MIAAMTLNSWADIGMTRSRSLFAGAITSRRVFLATKDKPYSFIHGQARIQEPKPPPPPASREFGSKAVESGQQADLATTIICDQVFSVDRNACGTTDLRHR
jgi:hypothetical protein